MSVSFTGTGSKNLARYISAAHKLSRFTQLTSEPNTGLVIRAINECRISFLEVFLNTSVTGPFFTAIIDSKQLLVALKTPALVAVEQLTITCSEEALLLTFHCAYACTTKKQVPFMDCAWQENFETKNLDCSFAIRAPTLNRVLKYFDQSHQVLTINLTSDILNFSTFDILNSVTLRAKKTSTNISLAFNHLIAVPQKSGIATIPLSEMKILGAILPEDCTIFVGFTGNPGDRMRITAKNPHTEISLILSTADIGVLPNEEFQLASQPKHQDIATGADVSPIGEDVSFFQQATQRKVIIGGEWSTEQQIPQSTFEDNWDDEELANIPMNETSPLGNTPPEATPIGRIPASPAMRVSESDSLLLLSDELLIPGTPVANPVDMIDLFETLW